MKKPPRIVPDLADVLLLLARRVERARPNVMEFDRPVGTVIEPEVLASTMVTMTTRCHNSRRCKFAFILLDPLISDPRNPPLTSFTEAASLSDMKFCRLFSI